MSRRDWARLALAVAILALTTGAVVAIISDRYGSPWGTVAGLGWLALIAAFAWAKHAEDQR